MRPTPLSPDARAVVRAAEAFTTQVRRIADALTTPVAVIRDGVMTPLDDVPTTPATTCSAQHRRYDDGRDCVRAAHHHGDHIDERGYHWSDTVAVYPVDPGVVHESPAADEEQTLRWARRESLLVLLTRVQHGRTLTEDEARTLRQHVETEISEANTAREQARKAERAAALIHRRAEQAEDLLAVAHETSNKSEAARAEEERLRLALAAERDRWKARAKEAGHERDVTAADLETADRLRAEVQRDRDQHAAVLAEVLRHFVHKGHPGEPCLQTGWVAVKTVERWRSTIAPTVERPWWQQLNEVRDELTAAQAAIERVRAVARDWGPTLLPRSEAHRLLTHLCAALDSTEPPTTTQET